MWNFFTDMFTVKMLCVSADFPMYFYETASKKGPRRLTYKVTVHLHPSSSVNVTYVKMVADLMQRYLFSAHVCLMTSSMHGSNGLITSSQSITLYCHIDFLFHPCTLVQLCHPSCIR